MNKPRLLNRVLLTAALAAVIAAPVQAEQATGNHSNHDQNTGTLTGALLGAAVGGPPGLIIGAFGGSLIGRDMDHKHDLAASRRQVARLQAQLRRAQALTARLRAENHVHSVQVASNGPVPLSSTPDPARLIQDGFALTVQFRTDSDRIQSADRGRLQNLAAALQQVPGLKVSLRGFADRRGTDAHNLKLSQQRAVAVRDALVTAGLDAQRVTVAAYGAERPLTRRTDPDSRCFERRVLISFHQ